MRNSNAISLEELIKKGVDDTRLITELLASLLKLPNPDPLLKDELFNLLLDSYRDLRVLILELKTCPPALLERYDQLVFQLQVDHLLSPPIDSKQ